MQDVEAIRDWICRFPLWGNVELRLDQLGTKPEEAGLYYLGMSEISRQEDVTGGVKSRCKHSFSLRRIFLTRQDGALWMESFSRWVRNQSHSGATPLPAPCRVTAYGAKADWQRQPGTLIYTVRLDVEFEIQ